MIKAISSAQVSVSGLRRKVPAVSSQVQPSAIAQKLTSQLKIQGMSEAESKKSLAYIRKHLGSLRKPGFFNSPEVDLHEAYQRLSKGTVVYVRQSRGNSRHLKNLNDLFLLDDLMGQKQDHRVARPKLRLPLLYLAGEKLQREERDGHGREKITLYEAYKTLESNRKLYVNGKRLEAEQLGIYLIQKGLTERHDPELNIWERFQKLPSSGWVVNGREAQPDIAYLAFIEKSSSLAFEGHFIRSDQDFEILMSLAAGEDNSSVPPDLKTRLFSLDSDGFHPPLSHFNVYKKLEAGEVLFYQGLPFRTLEDIQIWDALEGSLRETPVLEPFIQKALLSLDQLGDFNPSVRFEAYQALKAQKEVVFKFIGGPTGEEITLAIHSLQELDALVEKVETQRARDQHRPDFRLAKTIVMHRLNQLKEPLASNLAEAEHAMAIARQDVPLQKKRILELEKEMALLKPDLSKKEARYLQDKREADQLQQTFDRADNNYHWEKQKLNRLEWDLDRVQRRLRSSENAARRAESNARREDGLASANPDKAAQHQRKAQAYRAEAQRHRNDAHHYRREEQGLKSDLRHQRWDLERSWRERSNAEDTLNIALRTLEKSKVLWQSVTRQYEGLQDGKTQAERQLLAHHITLKEGAEVQDLTASVNALFELQMTRFDSLSDYESYLPKAGDTRSDLKAMQEELGRSVYQKRYGSELKQALKPVLTLLDNMEKPAF